MRTRYILNIVLPIMIGITIISCAAQHQQALVQGVEGHIYELKGNQMPMKGRPAAGPKPAKAEVWIYEATTTGHTKGSMPLFLHIDTRLAAKVKTDANGYYQAKLLPGKYSIFIKQEGGLFAAETDGEVITPVTVTAGKVSKRDVTVTLSAAF
jgi:hypothetical protein